METWSYERLYWRIVRMLKHTPKDNVNRTYWICAAGDLRDPGQGKESYMQRRVENHVAKYRES